MSETNKEVATLVAQQPQTNQSVSIFADANVFAHAQRIANMLAQSDMVPKEYKGNIPNTMVALEMANRIGASPLAVMQNMNVIHGKPSWSSQFIIASINSCGRYKPLRFILSGEGDNRTCVAWTTDNSGERLESPAVSVAMAKKEGWFSKTGSKWQTMPELMLRYRAAAFFGRLYAPELMMGMKTADEVEDITTTTEITTVTAEPAIEELNKKARKKADKAGQTEPEKTNVDEEII